MVKAQLNEVRFFGWFWLDNMFSNLRSLLDMLLGSSVAFKVAVDGSSNAAASPSTKSDAPTPKESSELSQSVLATEESISEFISQVASLVK